MTGRVSRLCRIAGPGYQFRSFSDQPTGPAAVHVPGSYRMVSQNPERISFQFLAALCEIFGVEANELFTFTAAIARRKRQKNAIASGDNVAPFAEADKPVRARILDDD